MGIRIGGGSSRGTGDAPLHGREILTAPLLSDDEQQERDAAKKRAAEWLANQPPDVQEKERQFQENAARSRAQLKIPGRREHPLVVSSVAGGSRYTKVGHPL